MSWPTDKELPLSFIQWLLSQNIATSLYYSYDQIKAMYVEWEGLEKP